MKIGISQPTYLPWCGYIALIDLVDEFVFLDNVQFERRGWHQRNYVKFNKKKQILTVPVISKGKRFQKINETLINYDEKFIKKHIDTISQAYSQSKYFDLYAEEIFKIYNQQYKFISDLNINLIKFFCKKLNIDTKFDFSSKLELQSFGSKLIIDICKKKKCTKYISTIGSQKYINDKNLFINNDMELKFFEFNCKKYFQLGSKFIEKLSIIDILFNLGEDSLDYLRNNIKIIHD